MRHARPHIARPPRFAIAALCLALLGLALPRFDGVGDSVPVPAVAAVAGEEARAASASGSPSTDDVGGHAAPIATTADGAMVLQRATEAMQRPQLELGWSKVRAILAHALKDALRGGVTGDPVRLAEREVTAQESPLLRWRLAHSTSSAIG